MAPKSKAETETLAQPKMMHARQVLMVSAPGGPRRRAGLSFGPEPRDLREEDFGENAGKVIDLLRADPLLKIDARFEEIDAEDDAGGEAKSDD